MKIYTCAKGITTEVDGEHFPFQLAYHTYGKMNTERSNVKWVFHALTANSDAQSWWNGLFGEGKMLDPSKDFIVCANMPGSCYGSTGPLSENQSGEKFFHDFPLLTIRDIVSCFQKLKEELKIDKIEMGLGGSMGGSVLLEWMASYPTDFRSAVLVATSAAESSWGKAIHTVHKMAIESDATWKTNENNAGMQGLETARGVGMLFYRTYESFNMTQIDEINTINDYKSDSYIRYQGKKLTKRFNAFSYYFLLNSLDTHNVGRNRGSVEEALNAIETDCLIIGINSDILYPTEEQTFLHTHIPSSELHFIESAFGHDGFLIETEKINALAVAYLNKRG